jgi:hypothetical protein
MFSLHVMIGDTVMGYIFYAGYNFGTYCTSFSGPCPFPSLSLVSYLPSQPFSCLNERRLLLMLRKEKWKLKVGDILSKKLPGTDMYIP